MENNKIGSKISFWALLSGERANNVLIPSIQRDYTYGAQTEDTDKVLDNLLQNIENVLFGTRQDVESLPELTLNFVYGYMQDDVNYVPLDGQQRLTTLFLLHYYAALFGGREEDFATLERFTYATRETTKNYCQEIIRHHKDILESLEADKEGLSKVIEGMSWFIPSFSSDPSIRSMQVVFGRIEQRFNDVKEELWGKLTTTDCPVNFYLLNFGPFHLSDDLYVKMNSRGKKLTEYEIFKSALLKHIEKGLGNRTLKRELAVKFDNQWTDLVWESIGKPFEEDQLARIDEAYILLMKLVLRYLSYLHGYTVHDTNIKLNPENIARLLDDTVHVRFLESFMDVFSDALKEFNGVDAATDEVTCGITRIADRRKYAFSGCLNKNVPRNGDCLFLYGVYLALKARRENPTMTDVIRVRIRHLRNVIENSDNEIRDENMPSLIGDVTCIMDRVLDPNAAVTFNKNQWAEESEKQRHIPEWKQLWTYEEHDLLRGALSSFADGQVLDFGSHESINKVKERLEKFSCIFNDSFKANDVLIRAALLTVDDYSQYLRTASQYRIIGNIPMCWRPMFVKNDMRHRQDVVMSILDKLVIDRQTDVKAYLERLIDGYLSNPSTDKTDWRYYVVKYRKHTHKAYTHTEGYGYYYIGDPAKSLEVAILQSSGFGATNVAWYLIHLILTERNRDKYNLSLGTHAANPQEENIIITTQDHVLQLGVSAERGWYLLGLTDEEARGLGLVYTDFHPDLTELVFRPSNNEDYIEWAEGNILSALKALPGFVRPQSNFNQ